MIVVISTGLAASVFSSQICISQLDRAVQTIDFFPPSHCDDAILVQQSVREGTHLEMTLYRQGRQPRLGLFEQTDDQGAAFLAL